MYFVYLNHAYEQLEFNECCCTLWGSRLLQLKKKQKQQQQPKKNMYLIVEFVEEGTTGPVAKSWYSDGQSWWPPFRDLDRLLKSVRMMEAPQPDKGWTKHQARVLHESGKLNYTVNKH